MRNAARYNSVSGNPVIKDGRAELHFITDPAVNKQDVTVEMSVDELERLVRRISLRLGSLK